jgi:hypothetical protein
MVAGGEEGETAPAGKSPPASFIFSAGCLLQFARTQAEEIK